MAILKSKHKGYKYGVLRTPFDSYTDINQNTQEYDEERIINFDDISGLTLEQLYNNDRIVGNYGLMFVMYDSIHIIDGKKNYDSSIEDYIQTIYNYNKAYVRLRCLINIDDFKKKKDEIIDNVIATKLIEHYEKGLIKPYNEERVFDFIEEFFYQIPEYNERENNMTRDENIDYLFGLYIDPEIVHENSFLNGFRKSSLKIKSYLDFSRIKGRTVEEISNFSDRLKNDKYMYFLMLDKLPLCQSHYEFIAQYYLEINIDNNKEKLIEELIKETIEDEFKNERLGGSFNARAQDFLDCYTKKTKEDRGKELIKSKFI